MKTISKEWIFEILDKTNAFAKQLITNHFDRHPQEVVLPEEAKELLNSIYCDLWMDAYVDMMNNKTKEFSKPIADKMTKLNEILKFKK